MPYPRVVTLAGILKLVKDSQFAKAFSPICVTASGIFISVSFYSLGVALFLDANE